MQWQDLVLAVSQLCFTIALLPTLLSKDKPALTTSLMNGTILLVVALTLSTLALWFAAVTSLTTCVLWFVLAVQKRRLARN
jgi:hypothetical protein